MEELSIDIPTNSQVIIGEEESTASSMDFDLEAFNNNFKYGSFMSLTFQSNAMINYINQ